MGKSWREMSESEKEKYKPIDSGNDEEEIIDLSPAKKKEVNSSCSQASSRRCMCK